MENKTLLIDSEKNPDKKDVINEFFDRILNHLVTDKMMHDVSSLPIETHNFYNDLANGNIENALEQSKDAYLMHIYSKLVDEYFSKLSIPENKPNQLGVCLSHSNMLIWAEISDDDEVLEDKLIMLQAEINHKYGKKGLFVKTTIVEESDKFKIPPHYSIVPLI
jgi:hypothetical protein